MRQAKYKDLEDGTRFGETPACPGVWGNAPTQQECEVDLQEALEDWILVGLHLRHPLPVIDGIDLNPKEQEVA
jgi:predicted RNase H-like HicB family nuclease